ncbi:MAG: TIGR02172 family protein [Bacteroidales bacterium]|nr:TIGR02172 family protein [Bacteroidales bacterium]
MKAIKIDMADYVHAGEGANGASYNHKTDPSIMLKLYNPGKIQQPLDEMILARKVFDTGIATPEPGDYVTDGERYGIRFHRIVGKLSYARAVGENPDKTELYAQEFAQMCKELHAVHVDTSEFECVKDRYYRLLSENPFFTRQEKDKLVKFIADVPDCDTAIHGDLQFGNGIFVGDKRYFIDLGDFCWGNPLFDLGMVWLTCEFNQESFTKDAFHMDNATASRFWKAFAPAYFGADRPLADIEAELLPFVGLKTIIVERDTRRPMPEFRAALKDILK